MMKIYNKYIKSLISSVLVMVMLAACTNNFDEINTNKNAPVDVSPALLLPTVIENTVDRMYGTALGMDVGDIWSQQWAKIQYTDEDRYEYRGTTLTNTWDGFFVQPLPDLLQIQKLGEEAENVNYQAVALTLKALVYAQLTEIFGDIPYTQAIDAAISQPEYDAQSVVYDGILNDLRTAAGLFDPAGSAIDGDILLDGDINHWIKFCNSLRMRYIMRVSGATTQYNAELLTIISEGNFITSNADNVMLQYLADAPKNNPIAENRKTRDDHRISANLVTLMGANSGIDARATVYMDVTPDDNSGYTGVPNGLVSSTAITYGLSSTSKVGEFFTGYNEAAGSVLTGAVPAMIISASEVALIRAEAAVTMASGENAQTMYEAAVTMSFEYYDPIMSVRINPSRTDAWGYTWDLAGELSWYLGSTPYAWNPAKALELIATQKYFVLFGQGIEPWTEYRRTGFPVLTPGPDATINHVPYRLPYPQGEQSLNKANYDAAVARQGADNLETKLWFMK